MSDITQAEVLAALGCKKIVWPDPVKRPATAALFYQKVYQKLAAHLGSERVFTAEMLDLIGDQETHDNFRACGRANQAWLISGRNDDALLKAVQKENAP